MNVEQQIDRINNMREQLELLETELNELREQCKQQPEFEYPIYMQSKIDKTVVKFTDLSSGEVMVSGNRLYSYSIGYIAHDWTVHTDTTNWQKIVFDEERGIADKQLCECWVKTHTHYRALRFYDAVNKCTFSVEGKRNGTSYDDDNYLPVPYADYPDWAIKLKRH